MSKQQVYGALLEGFNPPIFPATLENLRKAQLSNHISVSGDFVNVGQRVEGFMFTKRPVTSDGYFWYSAMYFKLISGSEIAILFPWRTDSKSIDGDSNDRSIAVYIKGRAGEREVNALINELQEKMNEWGRIMKVKSH